VGRFWKRRGLGLPHVYLAMGGSTMPSRIPGPCAGAAEVKLSDVIIGGVISAWKIGREALAFLVIGTAAILLAFWLVIAGHATMAIAFLLVGCAIIGIVVYRFYVDVVLPAAEVSKRVRQNAELMDAVQDAALQLTGIINEMNDYALLNADRIVTAIDNARVTLNFLPGGRKVLELDYFKRSESFAKGIRRVAAGAREVVADIQDSVTKADATRILNHVGELKRVKSLIEVELLR
jgi:hypothetical protein